MKFTPIAKTIIEHSLNLTGGNNLYISVRGESQVPLAKEIERLAKEKGIKTTYLFQTVKKYADFFENASEKELDNFIAFESKIMRDCDGVVLLRENLSPNFSAAAQKKNNKYKPNKTIDMIHKLNLESNFRETFLEELKKKLIIKYHYNLYLLH